MSRIERPDRDVPHLRAVPPAEGNPAVASARAPAERSRGWGAVLLATALLLALVGLAVESRRASRLEGEVAALHTSLAEARSALAAHRQRLAEARQHVSDLRGRVETLDALLQSDPVSAAPPAPSSATPRR